MPCLTALHIAAATVFTCSTLLPASGQYAVGIRAGIAGFTPIAERGSRSIDDGAGAVVGFTAQQLKEAGSSYRISLDLLQRSYELDQISQISSRREQFSVRQNFLVLSTEVRWRLSSGHRIYFDFGPMIGARITERVDGISFFQGYAPGTEDTLSFAGRTYAPFEINDIRLRFGPSADFDLGNNIQLTGLLSVAPGWSGWFRGRGYGTVDFQVLIALSYRISRALPAKDLSDTTAHLFPRNSKLTMSKVLHAYFPGRYSKLTLLMQ